MMTYKELIEYLGFTGHPLIRYLKNPLNEKDIQSYCNEKLIKLPQFLIEHFQVHNGVETSGRLIGELTIFPRAIPLSLEEAIETYQMNLLEKYWPITFFPLFESCTGDYYFIQLNPDDDFGMIYYYSPSDIDFDLYTTYFDSYESMINSVYLCYKEKIYFIKDGILDDDIMKAVDLLSGLNPKSEYWKVWQQEN